MNIKILNKSRRKYNCGFSLLEVIVATSISVLLFVVISDFYTIYIQTNLKTQRKQDVSSLMDIVRNTLISDYKFHRSDNHQIAANVNFSPNINRIRLHINYMYNRTNLVNGINIGLYSFSLALPLTSGHNVSNDFFTKYNTKLLTIEQLVQAQDASKKPITLVRRIEYSMQCQELPNDITDKFKNEEQKSIKFQDLLARTEFFNSNKCINKSNGYAREKITDSTLKTCSQNNTIVLKRDVWSNWNDENDTTTNNSINNKFNNLDNIHTEQQYPQSFSDYKSSPVLGIAFCTWVPSDEDLMTANNTEIELYYIMLNEDSFLNPNKPTQLEIKTERISLRKDSSITTNISPIK